MNTPSSSSTMNDCASGSNLRRRRRFSVPPIVTTRVLLYSRCLVSNIPVLVNGVVAIDVAFSSFGKLMSRSLNSLVPVLNLSVDVDGRKNEPATYPSVLVVSVEAPAGCDVARACSVP